MTVRIEQREKDVPVAGLSRPLMEQSVIAPSPSLVERVLRIEVVDTGKPELSFICKNSCALGVRVF